jgi:hypothetical protein
MTATKAKPKPATPCPVGVSPFPSLWPCQERKP